MKKILFYFSFSYLKPNYYWPIRVALISYLIIICAGLIYDLNTQKIEYYSNTDEYLNIPKKYSIRFHLHPDIQVNVTRSKKKALIKLPDGSGWEFLCSEPRIVINESIYLGEKQRIIKNNHILIKNSILPEKKIKWLFRQI